MKIFKFMKKQIQYEQKAINEVMLLNLSAILEPRVSIAYQLNESSSVKASYNRMSQYLHLLSNTSSPTPLDVWTPSGKYIKPQILDQVAIGYFKNFKDYRLFLRS